MIGCIGTVVTNYAKIDMYRSIGVYTSGQYLVATNHPKKKRESESTSLRICDLGKTQFHWLSVAWNFYHLSKTSWWFQFNLFQKYESDWIIPQGFGVKIPKMFETRKWVPRKRWCKRLISTPFSKKDQMDKILTFRESDPPKSCWIFFSVNVNLQIAPLFVWWRITGCDPVFWKIIQISLES